jgi:hypothetical protein
MRPKWASTPRRIDRLIVGRNVTLTLTHRISPRLFPSTFIQIYYLLIIIKFDV